MLFGIATLEAAGNLVAPEAGAVKLEWLVIWLIGLAAVTLLWRHPARAFFRGTPA